jgi:hypothetical protein
VVKQNAYRQACGGLKKAAGSAHRDYGRKFQHGHNLFPRHLKPFHDFVDSGSAFNVTGGLHVDSRFFRSVDRKSPQGVALDYARVSALS